MKFPYLPQGVQHDFDHVEGHGSGGVDCPMPQQLWHNLSQEHFGKEGRPRRRRSSSRGSSFGDEDQPTQGTDTNSRHRLPSLGQPYQVFTDVEARIWSSQGGQSADSPWDKTQNWCEAEWDFAEQDAVRTCSARELAGGQYIPFNSLFSVVRQDRQKREIEARSNYNDNKQRLAIVTLPGYGSRELIFLPGGKHLDHLKVLRSRETMKNDKKVKELIPQRCIRLDTPILEILGSRSRLEASHSEAMLIRTHGAIYIVRLKLDKGTQEDSVVPPLKLDLYDVLDFSKCIHGMPCCLCWSRSARAVPYGGTLTTDEIFLHKAIGFFIGCFDGTVLHYENHWPKQRLSPGQSCLSSLGKLNDFLGHESYLGNSWTLFCSPWPMSFLVVFPHGLYCVSVSRKTGEGCTDATWEFRESCLFTCNSFLGMGEKEMYSIPSSELLCSCVTFCSYSEPISLVVTSERILLMTYPNKAFLGLNQHGVPVGRVHDERRHSLRSGLLTLTTIWNIPNNQLSPGGLLCGFVVTSNMGYSILGEFFVWRGQSQHESTGTLECSFSESHGTQFGLLEGAVPPSSLSQAILCANQGVHNDGMPFLRQRATSSRRADEARSLGTEPAHFVGYLSTSRCLCENYGKVVGSSLLLAKGEPRVHVVLGSSSTLMANNFTETNTADPFTEVTSGDISVLLQRAAAKEHFEDWSMHPSSRKRRTAQRTPKTPSNRVSTFRHWFNASEEFVSPRDADISVTLKGLRETQYSWSIARTCGGTLQELCEVCMDRGVARGASLASIYELLQCLTKKAASKTDARSAKNSYTQYPLGTWNALCCGRGQLVLGKAASVVLNEGAEHQDEIGAKIDGFLHRTLPRLYALLRTEEYSHLKLYHVPLLSFARKVNVPTVVKTFWRMDETESNSLEEANVLLPARDTVDPELSGTMEDPWARKLKDSWCDNLGDSCFLSSKVCRDKLHSAVSSFLVEEMEFTQLVRGMTGYLTRPCLGVFPSISQVLAKSLSVLDSGSLLHPSSEQPSLTSLFVQLHDVPKFAISQFNRRCVRLARHLVPILQNAIRDTIGYLSQCLSFLLCHSSIRAALDSSELECEFETDELYHMHGVDVLEIQRLLQLDHTVTNGLLSVIYVVTQETREEASGLVGLICPSLCQQVSFLFRLAFYLIGKAFRYEDLTGFVRFHFASRITDDDIPSMFRHWVSLIHRIETHIEHILPGAIRGHNSGGLSRRRAETVERGVGKAFAAMSNRHSLLVRLRDSLSSPLKKSLRSIPRDILGEFRYHNLLFKDVNSVSQCITLVPVALAVEFLYTSQKHGDCLPPTGTTYWAVPGGNTIGGDLVDACSSQSQAVIATIQKKHGTVFTRQFSWNRAISNLSSDNTDEERNAKIYMACWEDTPIARSESLMGRNQLNLSMLELTSLPHSNNGLGRTLIERICSEASPFGNRNSESETAFMQKMNSLSQTTLRPLSAHILRLLRIPHTVFTITSLLRQKFGHHIHEDIVKDHLQSLEDEGELRSFRQANMNSYLTSRAPSIREMKSHLTVYCSGRDCCPNDLNYVDLLSGVPPRRNSKRAREYPRFIDAVALFAEELRAKQRHKQQRSIEQREAIAAQALEGLYDKRSEQSLDTRTHEVSNLCTEMENCNAEGARSKWLPGIDQVQLSKTLTSDVGNQQSLNCIPFLLNESFSMGDSRGISEQLEKSDVQGQLGCLFDPVKMTFDKIQVTGFGFPVEQLTAKEKSSSRIGRLKKSSAGSFERTTDYVAERTCVGDDVMEYVLESWDSDEDEVAQNWHSLLNV
eukprot:gb/GECG01005778.1/.p1 GENE.gb/GECG01005778.1/~~gb/GECG01005778.1/.p1  ORF type:complete len:1786 (+),score=141.96 gb/GECG01005778.1/:1-5358(+)